jgi:arginase family enzyme
MPLRMLLDAGAVAEQNVALVAARALDPPEEEFLAASAVHAGDYALERALNGVDAVYVAFDADAVDPDDLASWLPEPGGLSLAETEQLLGRVRKRAAVLGVGLSGLSPAGTNVEPLTRLCVALGL